MRTRQLPVLFINRPEYAGLSFCKRPVHKKRRISLVVIVILLIGRRAVIPDLTVLLPVHSAHSRPVYDTLKPHGFKILHRLTDDPFKAQTVTDVDRFLPVQRLSCHLKADPVAFREYGGDPVDLFLRKPCQKTAHTDLGVADVLSELIQIPHILQIRLHNNIPCKRQGRVQLFLHPFRHHHIAVIADKPVYIRCQLFSGRSLSACKFTVYLQKKLHADEHLLRPALTGIDDHAPKLCIEKGQDLAVCIRKLRYGIRRIGIAGFISLARDISIKSVIPCLKLLQGSRLQPARLRLFQGFQHQKHKLCRLFKTGSGLSFHLRFFCNLSDPVTGKPPAFHLNLFHLFCHPPIPNR